MENKKENKKVYNIFSLVRKLYPNLRLDKRQFHDLWISLFSVFRKDVESLNITRREDNLFPIEFDQDHNYDANIYKRIIFHTPSVEEGVRKWIALAEHSSKKITTINEIKEEMCYITISEVELLFKYMESALLLMKDVIKICLGYAGVYNNCQFCLYIATLEDKEEDSLVRYLCQRSPICRHCHVSFVHHYEVEIEDYNIKSECSYNSRMVPIHSRYNNIINNKNKEDEDEDDRVKKHYCPFGICACCHGLIPSFRWPYLSFAKNSSWDEDIETEFNQQIEAMECLRCPKCNPDLNKKYECNHSRPKLTRFRLI